MMMHDRPLYNYFLLKERIGRRGATSAGTARVEYPFFRAAKRK